MFNSLRTRLTVWYIGLIAFVIVGFGFAIYSLTINLMNRDLNSRLEEMSRTFSNNVRSEAEEENAADGNEIVQQSVNDSKPLDYEFIVLSGKKNFVSSTIALPDQNIFTEGRQHYEVEIYGTRYRAFESPLAVGDDRYRLIVMHSTRDLSIFQSELLTWFSISSAAAILLAAIGGYILVRQSLSNITEMSRQAAEIDAGNLGERLTIKNERDEVGRLGKVMNELLARLDLAFEQQRRFMADASHELRTPLAIVRGESDVALAKDNRTASEYRSSLVVVNDESLRLTKIVEDLFTLARADAGQFPPTMSPVYLDEIVNDAVRSIGVLARERKIEIRTSMECEMPTTGDESLLRRLFLNLLDNAVKYNRNAGKVTVSGRLVDGSYNIAIADTGLGIPYEARDSIFDRFFRVDRARTRSDGSTMTGAGLGLSIAKWIAELHGGTIFLAESGNNGSEFQIILPNSSSVHL